MRKPAALFGLFLLFAAHVSRVAAEPAPIDTLTAQYLFVDGNRVYLRCSEALGPLDSVWAPGLGTVVAIDGPVLKLAVSSYFVRYQMGDTVRLLRAVLRRRAADVRLVCDTAVWDPLTATSASAFAAAGLFHRGLFRLTDDQGGVACDLARDWFWKGFDLFVVIDTTARFGDGTPVDAAAVKASLERYFWYRRDALEYSWQQALVGIKAYRSGRTDQVIGIIPRSRDTLQFNMERPLYDLPAYLATPALSIVRWRSAGDVAPVTATAGPYGRRVADTVYGRAPSFGRVVLSSVADSSARAIRIVAESGRSDEALSPASKVPAPELLVVRPLTDLGRQLSTFVRFASNREAIQAAAGQPGSRSTQSPYPDAAIDSADLTGAAGPDMEKARDARKLVRSLARARIGFAEPYRAVATYLVDAFKAWDLKATLVESGEACDLTIESLAFDGFLPCAYAENVLAHLGRASDDSLVLLLGKARQMADDAERAGAYRSLLVRIADDSPYIPMLQLGVLIWTAADLTCRTDWLGRPAGPVFSREEEQ